MSVSVSDGCWSDEWARRTDNDALAWLAAQHTEIADCVAVPLKLVGSKTTTPRLELLQELKLRLLLRLIPFTGLRSCLLAKQASRHVDPSTGLGLGL